MYKNIAGQFVDVYAYDTGNSVYKTGDAAQITAYIELDNGGGGATNDTNPTEVDSTNQPGLYRFALTQGESNGDMVNVTPKSSTGSIIVSPVVIYTKPGSSSGILADAVLISGDSVAADNLESTFDGTGYIHDTAPSTQLQLSGLSGGLAISQTVESAAVTQGSETNTYAATTSHDGTYHVVTDSEAGVGIDFYYEIDIGTSVSTPVAFHMHGYFDDTGADDKTLAIQAYNWNTASWETIETLTGATADQEHNPPLTVNHVGTPSADPGIVRIRFLQSASEAGNDMRIDHCTVQYVTTGLQATDILSDGTALDTTSGALDVVTLVTTTTTNTDMVGTDSAALASVCTEGRLAELDAANLPSDVDAILLDTGTTIPATIVTIDNFVDDLESRLTATRAGYLDELGPTNLPADVDAILTDTGTTLENRLIAIEADTDVIDDGTSGLVKIASDVAAILVDTGATLPTAGEVADAVWTEVLSDHYEAGTNMTKAATYIRQILSGMGYYKSVSDTGDGTVKWYDHTASAIARTLTITTDGDERTFTGS